MRGNLIKVEIVMKPVMWFGATAGLLIPMAVCACLQDVPKGYYLVQSISTYHKKEYGALSNQSDRPGEPTDATAAFAALRNAGVDGVEYEALWFDPMNVALHKALADTARIYGIDVWESDWRLQAKIQGGAFGLVPAEFGAVALQNDGSLQVISDEKGRFHLDVLNPAGVQWLLDPERRGSYGAFLREIAGSVQGYFMNETKLAPLGGVVWGQRPSYQRLPVYSQTTLRRWREYCLTHDIRDSRGAIVSSFPVDKPELAKPGQSYVQFIDGYAGAMKLSQGTKIGDLTRDENVWNAWFEFLARAFTDTWISPLATLVDSLNAFSPRWRGVLYFQLINWALSFNDPLLSETAPAGADGRGLWARDHGVDLRLILSVPHIRYFVAESHPPTTPSTEHQLSVLKQITRQSQREFGVMLHRDDQWSLEEEEENRRWSVLSRLQPVIIARFPHSMLIPTAGKHHRPDMEEKFRLRLEAFRGR